MKYNVTTKHKCRVHTAGGYSPPNLSPPTPPRFVLATCLIHMHHTIHYK